MSALLTLVKLWNYLGITMDTVMFLFAVLVVAALVGIEATGSIADRLSNIRNEVLADCAELVAGARLIDFVGAIEVFDACDASVVSWRRYIELNHFRLTALEVSICSLVIPL